MLSSDEIASLSESIKKLTAAVKALTQGTSVQSEMNVNKFGLGYSGGINSVQLSDTYRPTVHLNANEVMKTPTNSILPSSIAIPSAHHVFDQMPNPHFGSNLISSVGNVVSNFEPPSLAANTSVYSEIEAQKSLMEPHVCLIVETTPVYNHVAKNSLTESQLGVVDQLQDVIESAHKLFDEMPVPDFMLEIAQGVAACLCPKQQPKGDQSFTEMPEDMLNSTQNQVISPVIVNALALETCGQQVDVEEIVVDNVVEKPLDCICTKDTRISGNEVEYEKSIENLKIFCVGHQMFDGKPDPLSSLNSDHENCEYAMVYRNAEWKQDTFTAHIHSPLTTTLPVRIIVEGEHHPHDVELTDGDSMSDWPLLLKVISKHGSPLVKVDMVEVLSWRKEMTESGGLVSNLMLGSNCSSVFDFDPRVLFAHISSNCSPLLVFDPGVLFSHISQTEMHPYNLNGLRYGWKSHTNYKEVHSWGKVFISLALYDAIQPTDLKSYVSHSQSSALDKLGIITIHVITFDIPTDVVQVYFGGLNLDILAVNNLEIAPGNIPLILATSLLITCFLFALAHMGSGTTHACGNCGLYSNVDTSRWKDQYSFFFDLTKVLRRSIICFDLIFKYGNKDEFRPKAVWIKSFGPNALVWVFDLALHLNMFHLLNTDVCMHYTIEYLLLLWNLTLEDKGDFRGKEDRVYAEHTWELFNVVLSRYNCLSSWANNDILFLTYNSDSIGEKLDMKLGIDVDTLDSSFCRIYTRCYNGSEGPIEIFVSGLILVDFVTSVVRRLADSSLIMPYDPGGKVGDIEKVRDMARWVFDPGGFYSESGKTKQVGTSRCSVESLKTERCEDYKIYIFDPGIISFAGKSKETIECSSQHRLTCDSCNLLKANLILEDKDHFEGWVLIHTKIMMWVVW